MYKLHLLQTNNESNHSQECVNSAKHGYLCQVKNEENTALGNSFSYNYL